MTLRDWLHAKHISITAFAADLGKKPNTVQGWTSGRRLPGARAIVLIESATSGAVKASDFIQEDAA